MARFCTYCGNPVKEDARFCRNCGRQLPKRPVRPETREAPKQAVMMPIFPDLAASSSAGEFISGELTLPGMPGRAEPVPETLPPVSGLLHSVGSLFSGIVSLFRKPSALIGTLPLAVLWFVLAQFRDSDSMIVRILSWFTYAGGGFDRSVPGTALGVLGKGTVAAALLSLFTGGLENLFRGLGALFKGRGENRDVSSIILGGVTGVVVYFAFAGKNVSAETSMAGIAGALLSLEALGSGSGRLYELAQSLTSRIQNGVRTVVRGRCNGFLTGLTLGFSLGTVMSLFL